MTVTLWIYDPQPVHNIKELCHGKSSHCPLTT